MPKRAGVVFTAVLVITVAGLALAYLLNGGNVPPSTSANQTSTCPTAAVAGPNYVSNSTGAWKGTLSDSGGCPGKALEVSFGGLAQQLLVPPLASDCYAPGIGHYGALVQSGLNLHLWAKLLLDRPLTAPGGVSLAIARELSNGTVQRGTFFWILVGSAPENMTGQWNYAIPTTSQTGTWQPYTLEVGTRLLALAGPGWCIYQLTLVAGGGDSWFAAVYLGPK